MILIYLTLKSAACIFSEFTWLLPPREDEDKLLPSQKSSIFLSLPDKWKWFHKGCGFLDTNPHTLISAVVSFCTSCGKADGLHCIAPHVNSGKQRIWKQGTHHLYSTTLPLPFWNNDTACQKCNSFTDGMGYFGNQRQGRALKAKPLCLFFVQTNLQLRSITLSRRYFTQTVSKSVNVTFLLSSALNITSGLLPSFDPH